MRACVCVFFEYVEEKKVEGRFNIIKRKE